MPVRALLDGSDGVGSIVRYALERAEVNAPHRGSHQFRHALAAHMLRQGASLSEIGQVLRHRSPQSTSIYAKVARGITARTRKLRLTAVHLFFRFAAFEARRPQFAPKHRAA